MRVESSSNVVKAHITRLLVAFESGTEGGEVSALDIIEFIALRMRHREDYPVGLLGLFVRANLVALDRHILPFPEVANRLTRAATAASHGTTSLTETVEAGLSDLFL